MRFRFTGLDTYISKLEKLSNPFAVEVMVKEAVYSGAEIVADETMKALKSLPTDDSRNEIRTSIRTVQKVDLIKSFGIAPFQDRNGFLNVKTGIDKSKNRLGQRNTRVARQLESGTSRMPKNPVMSRASRRARKRCFEAMQKSLEQSYKNLMK